VYSIDPRMDQESVKVVGTAIASLVRGRGEDTMKADTYKLVYNGGVDR